MPEVHTAIHVRTGHGVHGQLVDAWLARHGVMVTAYEDAYAACVHLLTRYAQIPDLALLGTDWLAPDELQIVTFVRRTWPRTVIVLYGDGSEQVGFAALPLVRTCVGSAGLDKLCAESPAELVARACAQLPALAVAEGLKANVAAAPRSTPGLPSLRSSEPTAARGLASWPPRTLLTAEELAALTAPRDKV